MFSLDRAERVHVLAVLDDLGFTLGPAHLAKRTILDTADGRVHRQGLRLVAVESSLAAGACTLTLSGDDVVAATITVATAPQHADELPPGPFRARLITIVGAHAVRPQISVTAREVDARADNSEGGIVASASIRDQRTIDEADALDGRTTVTFQEQQGFTKRHRAALDAMESLGFVGVPGDALDLAVAERAVDLAGVRRSPAIELRRDACAADGFRTVLASLATAITAHWRGAIDDVDPEHLHDLRVAVRRSRSVLGEAARVLPPAMIGEARERWSRVGELTGPVRDVDVLLTVIETSSSALGDAHRDALGRVAVLLREQRAQLLVELRKAVDTDGADAWITAWSHLVAHDDAWRADGVQRRGDPFGDRAERPLRRVVRKRIASAQDVVLRHGRAITAESPDEALHDLRNDAKRLRYLLECFGALVPDEQRRRFVRRLRKLQDVLGTHHDSGLQVAHLRRVRDEEHDRLDHDALEALDALVLSIESRGLVARSAFDVRFARYDSDETRAELDDLLDRFAR